MTPAKNSGREHHKPARFPGEFFEAHSDGADPTALEEAAHLSAQVILSRGREGVSKTTGRQHSGVQDQELTRRLVTIADTEGIHTLASLWSHAAGVSLPGALWRLYALRDAIRHAPQRYSLLFREGSEHAEFSSLIAGVAQPPGPEEIMDMADSILAGVYAGEFDVALYRAAAFSRTIALGHIQEAHRADSGRTETAQKLTLTAERLITTAEELEESARLYRRGELS